MDIVVDKLQTLVSQLEANRSEVARLSDLAHSLKEQVDGCKLVRADQEEWDGVPGDHSNFIDLVKENRSLNQTIKQYEATMGVIMSKFRLQATSINKEKEALQKTARQLLEDEREQNQKLREENTRLVEKLEESFNVIRQALRADAEDDEEEYGDEAVDSLR
ncbi:hypothetical protein HDV05_006114 [Chytridiales sp. JEL 0842]|nr:hypothetical protein HDV05_006114 [Chytridiales sp. JEL 0842]